MSANSGFSRNLFIFSNINEVLSGKQEKGEDRIEKSIPQDHRLSSLGKPSDVNR